ncbi:MAG: nucleoside diphosphate kinase regulator [Chloroflexota bacterium]|nr:MAG: nucleoside diphosphate kinase regulator [Chloroflexota bacterium]
MGSITITQRDLERLRNLLSDAVSQSSRDYLEKLEAELNRATIVTPEEIPADVVTMNSTVRLVDLDTDEDMIVTLVYPDEADIRQGKISVLAPIGTGMIGYRVGDIFEWEVPEGTRRLKIAEMMYQPEAAGKDI